MVVNGTKQHPTKPNSAEHYRMVQIVAKRYWSVSKGTKRYWTVLSVSELNWYCTVPNDAEWYQMLPNKTQSLLLGNPTNPSMAVLGPLWLYEAGHWQIVPTKEYNSWMAMPSRFCTTIIWSRFAWECFRLSQSQFGKMSPTSPSLLTMSSSWRRELQGVHPWSGCGSIRVLRLWIRGIQSQVIFGS